MKYILVIIVYIIIQCCFGFKIWDDINSKENCFICNINISDKYLSKDFFLSNTDCISCNHVGSLIKNCLIKDELSLISNNINFRDQSNQGFAKNIPYLKSAEKDTEYSNCIIQIDSQYKDQEWVGFPINEDMIKGNIIKIEISNNSNVQNNGLNTQYYIYLVDIPGFDEKSHTINDNPLEKITREKNPKTNNNMWLSIISENGHVRLYRSSKKSLNSDEIALAKKQNEVLYYASIRSLSNSNSTFDASPELGMSSYSFQVWTWLHGVFELVAWGIIAEIGSYFPRYFRDSQKYMLYHSICSWLTILPGLVWTIIALIVDIILDHPNVGVWTGNGGYILHFTAGTTLTVLSIIEHFGGIAFYYKIKEYNATEKIMLLKYSHMILGHLLLLVSKFIIARGSLLAASSFSDVETTIQNEIKPGTGKIKYNPIAFYLSLVFIGLTFVIRFIFEYRFRKARKQNKLKGEVKLPPFKGTKQPISADQRSLLDMLNKGYSIDDIAYQLPMIKWCLYGSRVLDITNYIHPAGNYMLKVCYGREVGRYIFGGTALETTKWVKPHHHSKGSIKIIDDLTIGEIQFLDNILINRSAFQADSGSYIIPINYNIKAKEPIKWSLIEKKKLTNTISLFVFQSPNFKVLNTVKGVRWMGRHFNLSFANRPGKKRQYTTILCMNDDNVTFRNAVINYFESVIGDNSTEKKHFVMPKGYKDLKNTISFIVKKYNAGKGFSKQLHEINLRSELQKELLIEGPMGSGLELTEASAGHHILFAAGTGILPFLDLFHYILMKIIYEILKSKGFDAEAININNENYENTFDPSFRVTLYCSFSSREEGIGLEFVQKISEYSQRFNKNLLRIVIKRLNLAYCETIEGPFHKSWIEKEVARDATKILLCGPRNFTRTITKGLKYIGYSTDKIIFV